MSELSIKWKDFSSPTLTIKEYLNKFKAKANIIKNFETYTPKQEIVMEIASFLSEKKDSLKILALGADWCPDCSVNVPHMIKIVESLQKMANVDLRILYGIMVDALHKKGESIWHKKRSPPEAVDPRFNLNAIPTFYLFDSKGEFLGNIIEGPKNHPTLEEEILAILKRKF